MTSKDRSGVGSRLPQLRIRPKVTSVRCSEPVGMTRYALMLLKHPPADEPWAGEHGGARRAVTQARRYGKLLIDLRRIDRSRTCWPAQCQWTPYQARSQGNEAISAN